MMRRFLLTHAALAAMGSLFPIAAFAAPFCLTVGTSTPMCIYYDGSQCAHEAQRQNGTCDANPDSIRRTTMTSAYGDYCVITPEGGSRCGYSDGTVCSQDALRQKGVCTKAVGTGPKVRPDSYSPNANR
jgi:hypothetical protein